MSRRNNVDELVEAFTRVSPNSSNSGLSPQQNQQRQQKPRMQKKPPPQGQARPQPVPQQRPPQQSYGNQRPPPSQPSGQQYQNQQNLQYQQQQYQQNPPPQHLQLSLNSNQQYQAPPPLHPKQQQQNPRRPVSLLLVPLYQQQPPQELRQPNPLARQSTSDAERAELQLRDLFNKVDRNRNGFLSEVELSLALYNTDKTLFQPSTVRVMIKLFDKDSSGTIDFREFYHLWNYISHWRKVFTLYDKDKSNTITFSEYQETLKNFGYRLPTDTVLFVFQKFSHGGGGIYLKFDSYVESLIWLLRCTNSFKKFDGQETGVAVFPFDKYIQEVLSFQ